MGLQESPPPRQRHRVPHHRRRRHHHDHGSTAQTTHGKSALSLGRLNREYHAPDSHNVVESWLGQLTAPVPTSWLVSSEAQNQLIHHRKRQHSQDGHIFPCNQSPRRVDPLWRPQHIPPPQSSLPPRFPLPTNRDTKTKQNRQDSGDSSLISHLDPQQELRESGYIRTNPEYDESSCHKPLDDAEVGTAGASSPTSHRSIAPAFVKRPRHKTKANKYDTKKSENRERRKEDDHPPRRSKSSGRRPVATGKNVMKNFTSEAVLNDRITVQANLKPGLFGNKRVPKEHLMTDLSFSEMPSPTHQERDAPQQKGLSSSRLRERRRESRELEQISSLFLPARVNATSYKERPPAELMSHKDSNKKRLYCRDNTKSRFYQDSFATPSSPTSLEIHRQQSSISWENPRPIPNFMPSNPDCRPSSSGTTTYFTWPNSQDSRQAGQHVEDTRPGSMEPTSSATPESIRKALAATGVYNDTDICLYDVSDNQKNRSLEIRSESSSARNHMIHHVGTYKGEDSTMDPSCLDGTGATVALLAHLEARWNTIFPPEWKPRRSEAEVSTIDQQRITAAPDITINSESPSRHGTVKQARIKPTRDFHLDQHAYRHKAYYAGASPQSVMKNPIPVPSEEQIISHATPADQDRATISSRDAMPPPPIPPSRLDSLHSSSIKPGDYSGSTIRLESARPVAMNGQVTNYEHTQVADSDGATGQPRELGREPEKVIPTLDSASWIPQAVTSGIASYERDKTLSRLSMRSPIYEIQGTSRESKGALAPTPPPTTHMAESMADFIVRIESELEESASIDEYCQPEPIMKCRQSSAEAMMGNNKSQSERLTASDGPQIDRRHPTTGVADLELEGVAETNRRFQEYEELAAPIRDETATMPIECPRDYIDESLEMSNFWRPNRFSYF